MRLKPGKLLVAFSACLLPLAASCKAPPVTVNLTSGYSGQVAITCDRTGTAPASIDVDTRGLAEGKMCPTHPADLVVMRDGKRIPTLTEPTWETTGDNIPVGIRFSVR